MAAESDYVRTDEDALGAAVGRSVLACARACATHAGHDDLAGLRVAIQGCGAIGSAVAAELGRAGCTLLVADIDAAAVGRVAAQTGAEIGDPKTIVAADVDIIAPCAMGGVLTSAAVETLQAWAVCGAANNILAEPSVGERLIDAGIAFVPDILASAGAVIAGVCAVRGRDDAENLIAALGTTTPAVVQESSQRRIPTDTIAREHATARRANLIS